MVLTRGIGAAGLVLAALLSWPPPGDARAAALQVVRERTYRLGDLLVVDALVENVSGRRVDQAEVSDGLLSLEHTPLRPPALEPGQRASLRVATPYSEEEPPAWFKAGPGP